MADDTEQIDRDTLDDATREKLRALFDAGAAPVPRVQQRAPAVQGLAAGEVTDTHHPDSPGRVRVRWLSAYGAQGDVEERWLQCLRGQRPRNGDRVLLEQPANWPEPLVTGVLAGDSGSDEPFLPPTQASQTVKLAPEACLQIDDAQGKPLAQILASSEGPVVRLMSQNVNLEAGGKLRLHAHTLELEAGRGGVDIRTQADTVVRSRYIRLN